MYLHESGTTRWNNQHNGQVHFHNCLPTRGKKINSILKQSKCICLKYQWFFKMSYQKSNLNILFNSSTAKLDNHCCINCFLVACHFFHYKKLKERRKLYSIYLFGLRMCVTYYTCTLEMLPGYSFQTKIFLAPNWLSILPCNATLNNHDSKMWS